MPPSKAVWAPPRPPRRGRQVAFRGRGGGEAEARPRCRLRSQAVCRLYLDFSCNLERELTIQRVPLSNVIQVELLKTGGHICDMIALKNFDMEN